MEGGIKPTDWRLTPIEPLTPTRANLEPQGAAEAGAPDFVDVLRGQLDQLVELQNEADLMQQQLATGELEDINRVVLAVQKADLALSFALELRNKVVEAYQEISRMQI